MSIFLPSIVRCSSRSSAAAAVVVATRRRGLLVPVRAPPVVAAPYLLRHGSRRRLLGPDPALPEPDPPRGGWISAMAARRRPSGRLAPRLHVLAARRGRARLLSPRVRSSRLRARLRSPPAPPHSACLRGVLCSVSAPCSAARKGRGGSAGARRGGVLLCSASVTSTCCNPRRVFIGLSLLPFTCCCYHLFLLSLRPIS